jgi:hypothetical protein
MLQITPQMRILVAVEAVDFRKYAPSMVMWSRVDRTAEKPWRESRFSASIST